MSEHLWKQCGRWLCALEVLPSDHRIVQQDTRIEDLAYTLRDGVVLCHILATIDSNSINLKEVNQRPQMARFLCLKNIRIFLSTCTTYFNLKESELFEPSMLYDYTDFERVLTTLSRLSKCSKVKQLTNKPGFPARSTIHKEPSEEQIYQKLEDLVNDDTYEEFYYTHHGGGNSNYAYTSSFNERDLNRSRSVGNSDQRRRSDRNEIYSSRREEDIYADLCILRRSKTALNRAEDGGVDSSNSR
jgi:guanine nucleotide exchange factor VAV